MLYGRLLDKNGYRCEPLTDLSYPVVLLQGGESRGNRFIECLRGDLYGVLNVSKILYRNCARSKNHVQKRNIFAICSPIRSSRDDVQEQEKHEEHHRVITVSIQQPAIERRIRLGQGSTWAEGNTTEGPGQGSSGKPHVGTPEVIC
jgi:hypothetical protein